VELCSHETLFDREETHHLDHGISESLLKHVISTDAAACTPPQIHLDRNEAQWRDPVFLPLPAGEFPLRGIPGISEKEMTRKW